jgi:hypothetical protein
MIHKKSIRKFVPEIPQDEAWLFEPKNKDILARIKKSLKQTDTIDRGSFEKYIKAK